MTKEEIIALTQRIRAKIAQGRISSRPLTEAERQRAETAIRRERTREFEKEQPRRLRA